MRQSPVLTLCHRCCRNDGPTAITLWVSTTSPPNVYMASRWVLVCTGTCPLPVTRTNPQEHQGQLPCREAFLCYSPIRPRRWTWPQRPPSCPSPSTPPPSRRPTSPRTTTSRAKRNTPKKLGRARSPLRRYSSDLWPAAADLQVSTWTTETVTCSDFLLVIPLFFKKCSNCSDGKWTDRWRVSGCSLHHSVLAVGASKQTVVMVTRQRQYICPRVVL